MNVETEFAAMLLDRECPFEVKERFSLCERFDGLYRLVSVEEDEDGTIIAMILELVE